MKMLKGTWHINDMDNWDEDYFNAEVQAYITIKANKTGHFQFGFVSGAIEGTLVVTDDEEIFEFTWEGHDDEEHASGSGWVRLSDDDDDELEGEFHIDHGDSSTFSAERS